jgi:AcrR family transcriptional regulator
MAAEVEKVLRADARKNRDRVLEAASAAFADAGFAVPLDEIARRAGVGPGTVYRHFPTKQALFEAVVAARVENLVATARELAATAEPDAAFFDFLDRLVADAAGKRDLPDAIGVPGRLRDALEDAVSDLLARAQQAGAVRADVTAADLLTVFKRLLTGDHPVLDPDQQTRLASIVIAGLRATPS